MAYNDTPAKAFLDAISGLDLNINHKTNPIDIRLEVLYLELEALADVIAGKQHFYAVTFKHGKMDELIELESDELCNLKKYYNTNCQFYTSKLSFRDFYDKFTNLGINQQDYAYSFGGFAPKNQGYGTLVFVLAGRRISCD